MERIKAKYLIETSLDLTEAAAIIAGEQSSGTFVSVPGETAELKKEFAAIVENIKPLQTVSEASLPGSHSKNGKFQQAEIEISWNVGNFGNNLPVILSTLQGNLYELKQFTGIRLVDIHFPDSFIDAYRGPAFGIAGTRKLVNTYGRPLIGTIIKPSIGLTPIQTAEIVTELVNAGIDFIKDDELLSSSSNSPFEQRVNYIMKVIKDQEQKDGRKIIYAFNISGEMDEMMKRYELIVKSGGTCAMVSINSVGLSATKKICDLGELTIHGHRNGWGMLTRHPMLGVDFKAYHKVWRLAGVDQLHVNGIDNKFWETDDSVVSSINACRAPLGKQENPLPVVSSGQWGGQAFETYRRTKTIDLLYMAGGGIMAHPMGAAAGVKAIQQAWAAAVEGKDMIETAKQYPEFAKSVEKFGKSLG